MHGCRSSLLWYLAGVKLVSCDTEKLLVFEETCLTYKAFYLYSLSLVLLMMSHKRRKNNSVKMVFVVSCIVWWWHVISIVSSMHSASWVHLACAASSTGGGFWGGGLQLERKLVGGIIVSDGFFVCMYLPHTCSHTLACSRLISRETKHTGPIFLGVVLD